MLFWSRTAVIQLILKRRYIPTMRLIKCYFTSSDESIATVDADGKVTAGKTGVAEITARTANGMTAKCRIYVMGFEISLPSVCNVNQVYEVDINIYNNGSSDMEGRKG